MNPALPELQDRNNAECGGTGRQRLLLFLVFLLLVAVGVQSALLYRLARPEQTAAPARRPQLLVIPSQAAPSPAPAPAPPAIDPADPFASFFNAPQGVFDPFEEMRRMQEQMDRMFSHSFNRMQMDPAFQARGSLPSFSPETDLREKDDAYVIQMNIPGAEESNISVNLDDRVLTISGRTSQEVQQQDGNRMYRVERRSGQFQRSLVLPGPVDAAKMEAKYKDGVLTVTVPKSEMIPAKRSMTI